MIRSAKTLELSFAGLEKKMGSISPLLLECIREDFKCRHTCDERSTRSSIAKEWEPKGWKVDENMDELDTLFSVSNINQFSIYGSC